MPSARFFFCQLAHRCHANIAHVTLHKGVGVQRGTGGGGYSVSCAAGVCSQSFKCCSKPQTQRRPSVVQTKPKSRRLAWRFCNICRYRVLAAGPIPTRPIPLAGHRHGHKCRHRRRCRHIRCNTHTTAYHSPNYVTLSIIRTAYHQSHRNHRYQVVTHRQTRAVDRVRGNIGYLLIATGHGHCNINHGWHHPYWLQTHAEPNLSSSHSHDVDVM